MRIQQESQPPPLFPQPQFQLFPHPLLFPHRQERMIIQRIQLQELLPNPGKVLPPPLFPQLHPHPQFVSHPHPQFVLSSAHPQFVAAKSLILNLQNWCTLYPMKKGEMCDEKGKRNSIDRDIRV